jgi:3-methyladenine DNA glycosylase AlkD
VSDADPPTAAAFLADLHANRSDAELAKIQRYFKTGAGEYGAGDTFIGVRMGTVFARARAARSMPLEEIERLLDSPIHEARAGAVRIMAEQAKAKGATDDDRRALHDLYLRRIDRIDSWDLVDLGAWEVVGRYLLDHPRDELDVLAGSDDVWSRRTAVLATIAFIRVGQTDDAFRIAGRLVDDPHDLVRKAVGGVLRYAGDVDRPRLERFLETHAATMPRTALRYAIERLPPDERAAWLARR